MKFKSLLSSLLKTLKYIVLIVFLYLILFRFYEGKGAYRYHFNDEEGYLITGYSVILIAYIWYKLVFKKN